ncbi:MAG: TetR/AcrR family transcriptional regulator [Anaerovoracaceae bacterium]
MNSAITSKEAILQVCRGLTASGGLSSLSMRAVANRCQIALGTLYNYFPDKDALLLATVESIWKDIFHMDTACMDAAYRTDFSFPEYVSYLFDCAREGSGRYPGFFSAHSISIAAARRGEAKSIMEHYFDHMKQGMQKMLREDPRVSASAFSPAFTEEDFVKFVLDHLLLLLVQKEADCSAFVEILRRILYTQSPY